MIDKGKILMINLELLKTAAQNDNSPSTGDKIGIGMTAVGSAGMLGSKIRQFQLGEKYNDLLTEYNDQRNYGLPKKDSFRRLKLRNIRADYKPQFKALRGKVDTARKVFRGSRGLALAGLGGLGIAALSKEKTAAKIPSKLAITKIPSKTKLHQAILERNIAHQKYRDILSKPEHQQMEASILHKNLRKQPLTMQEEALLDNLQVLESKMSNSMDFLNRVNRRRTSKGKLPYLPELD